MEYKCPTCQRVLYNRRLEHCGFCGAAIPEELRFTAEEIAAMDREMAELEQKRAQRRQAASEEEEQQNSGGPDVPIAIS